MTKIMNVNNTDEMPSWQKELANAVKNPEQLLEILGLVDQKSTLSVLARQQFPMMVPHPYINKIKKNDIDDPLLKQVLPIMKEESIHSDYVIDPLGEHDNVTPSLLHKYKSRVLFIVKSGCAINCRYCFRRHFPYQDNNLTKKRLVKAVAYIKNQPDVNEVILSGGDPLMSKDDFLQHIITTLEVLPQLKRFRIHTRLPVVIPTRITPALVQMLKQTRLRVTFVLHINHPNEVDDLFIENITALKQAGIQLLNQSVLLKGVNDDSKILIALSEALNKADILPYYLFLLDKVQGAQHFDLSEKHAKILIKEMSVELPGYLVPKLSREIAGEQHKTIIN